MTVRYCGNFKCTLWEPIYTTIDDKELPRSPDKRSSKTAIVGRCTCCGAASGDCLRCGGGMMTFNINCKDCIHHGRKKCDIDGKVHHYCYCPHFEGFIEDIEQNTDCYHFVKFGE